MAKPNAALFKVLNQFASKKRFTISDRDLLQQFISQNDQEAFQGIVYRHMPMVLGVCLRTLAHHQDAEDACQAVFVLLAQKASRISWQESIANWLYATARKMARNAKVATQRRIKREGQAPVPETMLPLDKMTVREWMQILDEELDRLPPRYREPLVLCYLEGLTRDEAATRLGLPESTLKSQLERGRKKLANALTARGCTLSSSILLSTALTTVSPASSAMVERILKAVTAPSSTVTSLVQEMTQKGLITKTKYGFLMVASIGLLGLTLTQLRLSVAESQEPTTKPVLPKQEEERKDRIGTNRFRAEEVILDARYSSDNKQIVGHTETSLYVWDAHMGNRLRKLAIDLETFEDLNTSRNKTYGFAVHPKDKKVAIGGLKDKKIVLQIWDYDTGKKIAEAPTTSDILLCLEWTPDGKRLFDRSSIGWPKTSQSKLNCYDEKLAVYKSHDLPADFGDWCSVAKPLNDNKQVLLWQQNKQPILFDLDSGEMPRTLDFQASIPSDLVISPDGKTVLATTTKEMVLLDLQTGERRQKLPILRSGWSKPRPLFSPDSKTVYVWDHRPVAYDVATVKEKWKADFRTLHTVRMQLCDLSKDGSNLLVRHGQGLSLIDAQTGQERQPIQAPSVPANLNWSLDGKKLFTRTNNHDRTWTAWDTATNKRLYDLQPTGFVNNEDWKFGPDLFFIHNGKEIVVCLVKAESTEKTGPRELLVFDTATGKCLRQLGKPLPLEQFRWMYPIDVSPDGSTVVMQAYAVAAFKDITYQTVRWDPVNQVKLQDWVMKGHRFDNPNQQHPYAMALVSDNPDFNQKLKKPSPAILRIYSLATGKVFRELTIEFSTLGVARIQGNFLLTEGYDSKWVEYMTNSHRYQPVAPFGYDLWELPTQNRLRIAEQDKHTLIVLGPQTRYVVRVIDDSTLEIYEPFVLKKGIFKIQTPSPVKFMEFSPDGSRLAVSLQDTTIQLLDTTNWIQQVDEPIIAMVPSDLTPLWEDLSKETPKALRAARLLSVAGEKAVRLLEEKIAPKQAPEPAKVQQLLADLDSPRFAVREQAEKQLRSYASTIESTLRKTLETKPSAEVKQRIEQLLKAIDARHLTAEESREFRAVQTLKWMNTPASRTLLTKWSQGHPDANLTKFAKEN